MGRKYFQVWVQTKKTAMENILAFVDTGSDLTIIHSDLAKELKLGQTNIERRWIASNGEQMQSPIVEIEIGLMNTNQKTTLDEVLVEDLPMDPDSGEKVIVGVDFLQALKLKLDFDD